MNSPFIPVTKWCKQPPLTILTKLSQGKLLSPCLLIVVYFLYTINARAQQDTSRVAELSLVTNNGFTGLSYSGGSGSIRYGQAGLLYQNGSYYKKQMTRFNYLNPELIADINLSKHFNLSLAIAYNTLSFSSPEITDVFYKYTHYKYYSGGAKDSVVETITGTKTYIEEVSYKAISLSAGIGYRISFKKWQFTSDFSYRQIKPDLRIIRTDVNTNVKETINYLDKMGFIGGLLRIRGTYPLIKPVFLTLGLNYTYYVNEISDDELSTYQGSSTNVTRSSISNLNSFNVSCGLMIRSR